MRRRQADVDDDDIHRFASELGEQLLGIAALSNDVHSGLGEKPCYSLPEQDAVFGDRYTHGISALTRVPPP